MPHMRPAYVIRRICHMSHMRRICKVHPTVNDHWVPHDALIDRDKGVAVHDETFGRPDKLGDLRFDLVAILLVEPDVLLMVSAVDSLLQLVEPLVQTLGDVLCVHAGLVALRPGSVVANRLHGRHILESELVSRYPSVVGCLVCFSHAPGFVSIRNICERHKFRQLGTVSFTFVL